ncbi:helicase-related protein [Desulfococcaceae bacterium HSG8]|nr:helicase-related protein [Desulfococcaceae bacterium HSG8]
MIKTDANNWYYSPAHGQLCQVIETRTLWGNTTCRIWLPGSDSVVHIPAADLNLPEDTAASTPAQITYIAAAAKVADALTRDVLLGPVESSVIPLPHQIRALSRAISRDRIRYLLADEVGLGKTIEAGLIMRELKLRGLVTRTLVIAPKGLVTQWIAEMQTHFGEDFRLLIPSDFSAYRRISREENMWRSHDQIICSMDSVKPMDKRRGWSQAQIAEYNRERFEDLIAAGWDLVIVDEAHRLGGSTDQVARFKLGQGLAEAAPYLLMLSATPHQGKTDAFHRLVSLIDSQAFPDVASVSRARVQPYVIRTEKRQAIDADGKPLFKPRRTLLAPVTWEERHRDQELLYEAVTEYVRQGYNQAMKEKRSYIGFLMILMQRLVVSSTAAISTTLERRLEILEAPQEQMSLFPDYSEEDWADLDGQEQIETLLKTRLNAVKNERAEVKLLLKASRRCEQSGPDAKAESLLDWIYRLQQEESDPDLKVLVFTEFVPTQEMLRQFLGDRGFPVVCLNGSMNMDDRRRVQESFAGDARILISTDAGGEGLNLQFCHVVINYDIPWNPMRLEQRIGRVDRIGQNHVVRAVNFVFNSSVEHRVQEVLEEKLAVILDEFGIDKTGDVLDSEQAGQLFDDLYVEAILHPEAVESSVDAVVSRIHDQARKAQESSSVLGTVGELEPGEAQGLMTHPLPHWVESMTVSYLQANSGRAEKKQGVWDLEWPDGEIFSNIVFIGKDAEDIPTARHLTLEDSRIRGLAMSLPRVAKGQPIPSVFIPGVADEVTGFWSLWGITIHTDDWNQQRILPVFLHDDGRVLMPSARHIWNQLLTVSPSIHGHLAGDPARNAFDQVMKVAEKQGKAIYDELAQIHRERLTRERDKKAYAFAARRRAVERIGLPQVRDHRLVLLDREEREWHAQLERRTQVIPEMVPLLLIHLERGSADG